MRLPWITTSELEEIKLLYEKIIQEKDQLIAFLTDELNSCKKEKEVMFESLNGKLAQNI